MQIIKKPWNTLNFKEDSLINNYSKLQANFKKELKNLIQLSNVLFNQIEGYNIWMQLCLPPLEAPAVNPKTKKSEQIEFCFHFFMNNNWIALYRGKNCVIQRKEKKQKNLI